MEIADNVSKNLSERNVILDVNENSGDTENLYSDIDKTNKKIETVDDSLTEANEEKIENTNDKEVLNIRKFRF
ncbi:putative ethanolamine/propanediol utilization protein [Clostridioides difficile DA00165]|nr:putative ethanolamine/propanediol utilization protein [Clostridioides difficile DA00165]